MLASWVTESVIPGAESAHRTMWSSTNAAGLGRKVVEAGVRVSKKRAANQGAPEWLGHIVDDILASIQ